jgi:hypothetical protein
MEMAPQTWTDAPDQHRSPADCPAYIIQIKLLECGFRNLFDSHDVLMGWKLFCYKENCFGTKQTVHQHPLPHLQPYFDGVHSTVSIARRILRTLVPLIPNHIQRVLIMIKADNKQINEAKP